MEDRPKIRAKAKNEISGFGAWAIIILFWVFWGQGGWYRIDCALGVSKACDLIQTEYVKKANP